MSHWLRRARHPRQDGLGQAATGRAMQKFVQVFVQSEIRQCFQRKHQAMIETLVAWAMGHSVGLG
jgi:hypothetical protein